MFCEKNNCGARFNISSSENHKDFPPAWELQNATEKAAEMLRSEFLSQEDVDSILRGVRGDGAQENINKLGFLGSSENKVHGEVKEEHF